MSEQTHNTKKWRDGRKTKNAGRVRTTFRLSVGSVTIPKPSIKYKT